MNKIELKRNLIKLALIPTNEEGNWCLEDSTYIEEIQIPLYAIITPIFKDVLDDNGFDVANDDDGGATLTIDKDIRFYVPLRDRSSFLYSIRIILNDNKIHVDIDMDDAYAEDNPKDVYHWSKDY